MKKGVCFSVLLGCLLTVRAQLKPKPKCDDFYVDILSGTVNGLRTDFTM
ncbi:MAG TPA: hypothetical protein VHD35_00895 [Chitinophagaceae bacterium]|nr:hypothetical protein [Chitinophagaceae bacterium]